MAASPAGQVTFTIRCEASAYVVRGAHSPPPVPRAAVPWCRPRRSAPAAPSGLTSELLLDPQAPPAPAPPPAPSSAMFVDPPTLCPPSRVSKSDAVVSFSRLAHPRRSIEGSHRSCVLGGAAGPGAYGHRSAGSRCDIFCSRYEPAGSPGATRINAGTSVDGTPLSAAYVGDTRLIPSWGDARRDSSTTCSCARRSRFRSRSAEAVSARAFRPRRSRRRPAARRAAARRQADSEAARHSQARGLTGRRCRRARSWPACTAG